MTDDFWKDAEIIDAYTDEQAVDDGIVIPVSFGIINRVTRPVFDDFVKDEECDLARFNIFMDKAIEIFDSVRQKKDDWFYKVVVDEIPYFVCQNDTGYFTLMKPEDY
ncbi:MAG: hypothetical protein JW844_04740 [Candidatus Omnitrophica bacterium]|nr:hypothetical protein [Candidatus Omnitrophota bacterium]